MVPVTLLAMGGLTPAPRSTLPATCPPPMLRLYCSTTTVVFARAVGPTCLGDTYVTANSVPNIIFEVVAGLSDDLTLLFIEHDMHVVFRFATHIIVLVGGAIFTQGTPTEIAADPGVREVYLGTRKHG